MMPKNLIFTSRPPAMRLFYLLMPLAIMMVAAIGCSNPAEKVPDTSAVKIDLQTFRFDLDLYALDTNHIGPGLQKLREKYPDFLDYYLDTLRAYHIYGNYNDTVKGIDTDLRVDLTYADFVKLEDSIKMHYPDKAGLDNQLLPGFKLIKYYLPGYQVPRIMYLNMGLSKWPSFPVDPTLLCVGLDMFLGDQYPHYKDVGAIPAYMAAHFRRSYLPVSLFHTVYQAMHPFNQEDKTLLDLMLQRGKEQYFLHKILPGTPDSILFGFTAVQLDWCAKNEALTYNFFIHQKLLYNREGHSITPYVYDGPFAKDMESPDDPVKYTPGNIGTWLGYRIVCAYMANHKSVTLEQLLNDKTDAPAFLEAAAYRPK